MTFQEITNDDLKELLTIMNAKGLDFVAATTEMARDRALKEDAAAEAKRKREQSETPEPKRKRKRSNSPSNNLPPAALPEEFKRVIEEMARERETTATAARLVIEKGLFETDVSGGHNRLSIPRSQIADDFLTAEEMEHLRGYEAGKKKKFIEVTIVQPSLAPETVKFSRWDMPKKGGGKTSTSYVINGNWNAIVERNKLRGGMVVQLWCFRIERDLCFALVRS